MNFAAVEKFLSKLPIKDRDSHATVPFKFKYNQKKLHQKAAEMADRGQPIRLIVDKARRVTCSSWTEGVLFCHNIWLPGSHALIVAHEFKTSKELFRVPKDFLSAVPWLNIRAVERELTFPFPGGQESKLQILTAGKDTSGRGFTLSALHCSEAAHYISSDAFISLLPALSSHKNTIGVIESTPNGMEGDGETFYNMWIDAVEERSEWEAVFLSWTDDPACVAPEEFAKDAPIDDEEKDLLKRGFSKAQLAWRRLKINSPECGGNVDIFCQEYPCVCSGTYVSSEQGIFPVEQASQLQGLVGESGTISAWKENPPIAVYKLRTKYGRELRGTAWHPVAVPDGFINLSELQLGQPIVLKPPMFSTQRVTIEYRQLPTAFTTVHLTNDWFRFIGYFMGNGCWYGNTVSLCGNLRDEDVSEDCRRLMAALFGEPNRHEQRGAFVWRKNYRDLQGIFTGLGLIHPSRRSELYVRWVHVPQCVWRAPEDGVREFLRGLFESDGSASSNIVRFATKYEPFARDVQLLLLGFGINAEIRIEKRFSMGKEFTCYVPYLYRKAASLFHERIGFIGERKRNSLKPLSHLGAPPKNHELIDYVESVCEDGTEVTYDLTVEPDHVFSANGILTHNTTWEESFISSGMPAFADEEKRWAKKQLKPPKARGFLERSLTGEFKWRDHYKGDVLIWEDPIPGHYYYAGLDAARGGEFSEAKNRDFSALVLWDGMTGHQAVRYAGYSVPEVFACYGASIGRKYNKAMLNPELTGGYGYSVLSMLRDQLKYPNLYFWKGKDDRIAGSKSRTSFGFETTGHTRTMLFEQFRVALREAAGTEGDYGITIYDEMLASQIDRCTRKDFRFEIEIGHDDVLFGAMLGNIAMRQWAPPRSPLATKSQADEEFAEALRIMRARGNQIKDDARDSLTKHFNRMQGLIDNPPREDRELVAEGIDEEF